jgi:hypothetical protein
MKPGDLIMIKRESKLDVVNMSKLPGPLTNVNPWCGSLLKQAVGLVISTTIVEFEDGPIRPLERLELLCLSGTQVGWIDAHEVVLA